MQGRMFCWTAIGFATNFITSTSATSLNDLIAASNQHDFGSAHRLQIQGAGSSLASQFYQNSMFGYEFVNASIYNEYISIGSGAGLCRVLDYESKCKTPFNGKGVDVATPI
jgi:ABC-type phosphate transport system substrate-binding protein